jgi:hypothetical protein
MFIGNKVLSGGKIARYESISALIQFFNGELINRVSVSLSMSVMALQVTTESL